METSGGVNQCRVSLQPTAAFHLHLLQCVKRSKGAIGQRLIAQWPQAFGRLHLRRIGWQKHQMDPLGNDELRTGMPPGPVQKEHHAFVWADSCFLGKESQGLGEDLHIHGRQQQPTCAPALWMHTGVDVHPFVALRHHRFDSPSFQRPDPPQDRLEADTVLIGAPEFHTGLWICLVNGLHFLGQFF